MATIYPSPYTGAQVDAAVEDKVEARSLDYIRALSAKTTSTSKLFIATDNNTLWRSNGTSMIPIVGGSGTGGDVTPITDTSSSILTGTTRLAGLTIGSYTYKISYVSVAATTGTSDDYTMTIKN